jgi:hypothetical protein
MNVWENENKFEPFRNTKDLFKLQSKVKSLKESLDTMTKVVNADPIITEADR